MLEIRTLEQKSVEELTELFNFGFQEYVISMDFTPTMVETMIRNQNLRMDLSVEGCLGQETVGFCWLGVRGEEVWVGGIGVGPEYRGQGYGRQLLSHCIEKTRQLGFDTFALECIVENERAIQLYQSLGLEVIGKLYNYKQDQPQVLEVEEEAKCV